MTHRRQYSGQPHIPKDNPMSRPSIVVGIDQGTTGTTVLMLDVHLSVLGRGYREIPQSYPSPGLVEHDPEALWQSVLAAFSMARAQAGDVEIAAIGLTNQRETTLIWERATGRALAPAIVWQDRRTADRCEHLRAQGLEAKVRETTGLVIDPYFSATKIAWLLDHVPDGRRRAEAGELAFGTVDSYLMWRLSGGQAHLTDVSNASRTLLLDLRTLQWSPEMCGHFGVPATLLPRLAPTAGRLLLTRGAGAIPDGIPVTAAAGDQQAALWGQDCRRPGDAKCTFGTGAFLLMNVGEKPVLSRHRLLGTVAWQTPQGTAYALEGSTFVSGALIQWLRDGLGIIKSAAESEALAASVPDDGGVTIVPALAGLGAPYWRPGARGAILGLTRGTTAGHLARAALQAMALQTVDLVSAMQQDADRALTALRVDGGATNNDLLMQIQADLLGADIVRPAQVELTALGAARLAALGAGFELNPDQTAFAPTVFHPRMPAGERERILAGWRQALARTTGDVATP
jgi:glycerol kinase